MVESYGILLVLAVGINLYGVYMLIRAWRASRAAESAWYAVENRQIKGRSANWGLQAVVLLIVGALLLIWIALKLQNPPPAEPPLPPRLTTAPTPSEVVPLRTSEATATEASTVELTATLSLEASVQTLIPIPTLVLGSQAVITNTGGGGLWMRDAPYGNGLILLPEGVTIFVRGGLVEVEGLLWQSVSDAEGREGWVAADYLLYR